MSLLKEGTFVNRKFDRLFLGLFWGWLAYCINLMTDSLISGNQLGETSLQAVTIVMPLFSIIYFFVYLVSPGASVIFGKLIGKFRQEDAYHVAGTSLTASVLIGVIIAVCLFFIKEPFLVFFGCSGQLYQEASAYYNWLIPYSVIFSASVSVYYLTVTDGEGRLSTLSSLLEIAANVVLSVVLARVVGIAGLGIATCAGNFLKLSVSSLHFLKKTNNVKFRFGLDMKVVRESIILSFSRYMSYLFLATADIVMNKFIITNCGLDYIPAYSVVNLVFGVCELYGAIYDSGMGFLVSFLGERNKHGMALVIGRMLRYMLVMSLVICLFFLTGAPLMPVIYGLESPVAIESSITTARIMSFTALGYGVCYLGSEISCSIEKPGQACSILFLCYVFAPLLLSLSFGTLWGFTGIAVGMSLSPYLAFGIYSVFSIRRNGRKGFPLYFNSLGEDGISFDLIVTPDSIVEIRDMVSRELTENGYRINNIMLLMEEFYTRVLEKNTPKKVLSECTLLFSSNRVKIIIRDDGTVFNYVDENNMVESLNAHVLNCLLENTRYKNYTLTTSFNRNAFVFEKTADD